MHPANRTDRRPASIVAVLTALAFVVLGVVGPVAPARAADAATLDAPATVVVGQDLALSGAGWLTTDGTAGSVIAFKLDEGAVLATGDVLNPSTGAVVANKQVYAATQANSAGAWSVRISLPRSWGAGETHSVRLLSGSMLLGDTGRSQSATFDVVAPDVAPKVTGQPGDATVTEGGKATFSAAASGTPKPEIQWQTDAGGSWQDLSGETKADLVLDDVELDQDGDRYRAVFTNAAGTSTSDPAALTVKARPAGPATIDAPAQLVAGEDLVVTGTGWVDQAGTAGSVVAAKLDEGAVLATGDVVNPATGEVVGNKTIVAVVQARKSGSWTVTVPFPKGWAAGETHSIRFLTGSLLPGDVVRSQAASFVVVAPDRGCAADEVLVSDTAGGQTATACVQRDVSTGGTLAIRGDGWTSKSGTAGATVVLKLTSRPTQTGADFQFVRTGASGDAIVAHPGNGKKDATIWAIARADADGHFATTVAVPRAANVPSNVQGGALRAGSKLVVHLQTGLLATDTTHSVDSASLVVDGTAYAGDRDGQATACRADGPATATVVAPAGQVVDPVAGPVLAAGGTLHLVGSGWCASEPADGGSVIGIKIDEGAFSHVAGELVTANPQVWALIRVDSADGSFDTTITLPAAGSGAGASTPAFVTGAHALRLLSGSLKSGDVIRSVETGTFTVGTYRPNGLPDPVEATEDLTSATRHGVTVSRSASALTVTVPGVGDGTWAYLTAYLPDGSVRYPFGSTWYTTDGDVVRASLAGVTLPTGTWRLVVQSPNGTVLGWASVTVPAAASAAGDGSDDGLDGTADDPTSTAGDDGTDDRTDDATDDRTDDATDDATDDRTAPGTTPGSTAPQVKPVAATVSTKAPTTTPEPPAADGDALARLGRGGVTATQQGGVVTLTLPDGVHPGDWVFVYVYSTPTPVAWVQVDVSRQVRVDLSKLEAGEHKVALLDRDGGLVGWAPATVEGETAAPAAAQQDVGPQVDEPQEVAAPVGAAPAAAAPAEGLSTLDGVLMGMAVGLLLVGAAVVVVVRRRRSATPGGAA